MPDLSSQSANEYAREKTQQELAQTPRAARLRFVRPANETWKYSPVPHRVNRVQKPNEEKPTAWTSLETQSRLQVAIYCILKSEGIAHPTTPFEWTYTGSLSKLAMAVRSFLKDAGIAQQTILRNLQTMVARHEVRVIKGHGKYPNAYVVLPWGEVAKGRAADTGIGKDMSGKAWYIGRLRRLLTPQEITDWQVDIVQRAANAAKIGVKPLIVKNASDNGGPSGPAGANIMSNRGPGRAPPPPSEVANTDENKANSAGARPNVSTMAEIEGVLGAIPRYLHRDRKIAVQILDSARAVASDATLDEVLEAMRRGISGSPKLKTAGFFLEAVPGHIEMIVESRAERAAEARAKAHRDRAKEADLLAKARQQYRDHEDYRDDIRQAWPGIDFEGGNQA